MIQRTNLAYPFYWSNGDAKIQTNKFMLGYDLNANELADKNVQNLKWIQNTTGNFLLDFKIFLIEKTFWLDPWLIHAILYFPDILGDLPFGADKWIIGNYMRQFAQFRINYDLQNWILLTEQLIKNANVSDAEP
jgi:hypothetical protein